jgi:hypothetical protein
MKKDLDLKHLDELIAKVNSNMESQAYLIGELITLYWKERTRREETQKAYLRESDVNIKRSDKSH